MDATQDDGSCEIQELFEGCVYATAMNYDPDSHLRDDGSCMWSGCTDEAFAELQSATPRLKQGVQPHVPVFDIDLNGRWPLECLMDLIDVLDRSMASSGELNLSTAQPVGEPMCHSRSECPLEDLT